MIFLSFLIGLSVASADGVDCVQRVSTVYNQRLINLEAEGVIKKDDLGNWQPTMSPEELYGDRRFRNFPAISYEQVRWCPQLAAVESSISFLQIVGFKPGNVDTYIKRLLLLSENTDLIVFKDQVGPTNGRQSFKTWSEQRPEQKDLLSHYAMAVYQDPSDEKIKARAGSNFIGFRGDLAVFTLPYHALFVDDQKKSCSDFEFYFPKAPKHPLKAQATLSEVGRLDIVFCGLKLTENHQSLRPATMDAAVISRTTPFLTLGVGTLKDSKKLELTIDASEECQSLVAPDQGQDYESGVIDTTTRRWAMGCDVSAGNSGDGVYNRETGRLVGFVTARSPFTYQMLGADVFTGVLSLERLYMETSHFVPLNEIVKAIPLRID